MLHFQGQRSRRQTAHHAAYAIVHSPLLAACAARRHQAHPPLRCAGQWLQEDATGASAPSTASACTEPAGHGIGQRLHGASGPHQGQCLPMLPSAAEGGADTARAEALTYAGARAASHHRQGAAAVRRDPAAHQLSTACRPCGAGLRRSRCNPAQGQQFVQDIPETEDAKPTASGKSGVCGPRRW